MMAAREENMERLHDRLPRVEGRYVEDAPLDAMTWFRVGGPAEILFEPRDRDDLAAFLEHKPADVPVTMLGLGSNLLVRDGGVPGVVIRLGRGFARIEAEGATLKAGAGASNRAVAMASRDAAIAGLEFLSGIPGTLGGALRMNAGAYGRETKDVAVEATALDSSGQVKRLPASELGFSYRHTSVPDDWVFTSAILLGERGDAQEIGRRIAEIAGAREETQPIRTRTGGSTFKNPEGAKAWELIERAGCRGLQIGGAAVSEKHCNFLINTGCATAADLEALGEEVRRRVLEATGVALEWEIRRIGVPAEGGGAA
ncbi:MAG: UDP-N-acetylmuramate dehydrogenase [Alphaproteobacteria bacterium]|nr:UDP-N-acetylmuramate dehydrogenase [Alphaproteobacteria bacterium]